MNVEVKTDKITEYDIPVTNKVEDIKNWIRRMEGKKTQETNT